MQVVVENTGGGLKRTKLCITVLATPWAFLHRVGKVDYSQCQASPLPMFHVSVP